ncbi:hypothetical protein N7504_003139 [Penicillium tannophilum]|nr:hypothetical protein N7504_003139 [Penicillium tannophilum]
MQPTTREGISQRKEKVEAFFTTLRDTVEQGGGDGEVVLRVAHVLGAGLPVGLLGFASREDVPFVRDGDVPERVCLLGDDRGDVLVIAGSGIGDDTLAMGLETGGIGSRGTCNVEGVDCAARADDLPVGDLPGGGLSECGRIGQAQGQEGGKEGSELHVQGNWKNFKSVGKG